MLYTTIYTVRHTSVNVENSRVRGGHDDVFGRRVLEGNVLLMTTATNAPMYLEVQDVDFTPFAVT